MSEDKQPEAVSQNSPEDQSSQDSKPTSGVSSKPPAHLGLDIMATQEYKTYVDKLKLGKVRGITGDFGSAVDLLCDSSEPERPARIDVTALQPENDEDFRRRALYLAHLHRINTRQFLSGYMSSAKSGDFGLRAKKSIAKLSNETFSDVVKEFTCAGVYMTAIEQFERDSSPDWLEQFFGASLRGIDELVYGISVINMIERLYSDSIAEMSIRVAEDLCGFFDFGGIGDLCWSQAYSFMRDSGEERNKLLNSALVKDMDTIKMELGKY